MTEYDQNKLYSNPRYPIFDLIDKDFFSCLDGYRSIDLRSKQLGIMECVRVLDLFFYRSIHLDLIDSNRDDYEQTLNYGYPVFIKYLYEDFSNIDNCIIQPLTDLSLSRAVKKINLFTFKGLADNYEELLFLGEVKVISYENNYLRLVFSKNPNIELLENAYITEFSENMINYQKEKYEEILKKVPAIEALMEPLVFVYKDNYIGYSSTLEIEEFFFDLAYADTYETNEWNAFPPDSIFGGIRYSIYIDTILCLIGFSIKHLNFCKILQKRSPNIRLENILTTLVSEEDMIRLIMDRNNISREEAYIIIGLISINERNKLIHKRIRSASPPFIKISKDQYIRSICGLLDHPFSFFLDGLREAYPKDWDSNTALREVEFRDELYSLFCAEGTMHFNLPFELNKEGRNLTDVDACMADKYTGEIIFFQLKWQDIPFASNQKCLSRKMNFEKKTQKWVEVVNQWISTNPVEQLSSILGIPCLAINIEKIKLIVIGRFNSNYTNFKFPDNAVWGQWYQILVEFSKIEPSERSINSLFNYLKMINDTYTKMEVTPWGFKYQEYVLEIQ